MVTFFVAIAALVLGFAVYGRVVERVFGADDTRPTPAVALKDGVDFVPMSGWRIFLIQFLNIAGLGPIFGAIAGAQWGPAAYLWIVLGTLFAGGTHDYFSGMLSVRNGGASITELVGRYLGRSARIAMIAFSIVLLVLVGVVFVKGPADLLHTLTGLDALLLVGLIFGYYVLATVLPIDKLIGRIYPLFGLALLFMALGLGGGVVLGGYAMPELTLANLHPKSMPIFPFLFITIACGAISGFHATQSPLMARCLTSERQGRRIFYGAMVAEGVVALIWAAVAMSFFGSTADLAAAGSAPVVVNRVSMTLLGTAGGALAILGVVAAPITSGDTAFRAARLVVADALGYTQKPVRNRFAIALPMFAVAIAISFVPFGVVWRYFAWSNQTLATIALWTASAYLAQSGRFHWITTVPAAFMTAVTTAYILQAPEGFRLPAAGSNLAGAVVALVAVGGFTWYALRRPGESVAVA